MGTENEKCPKRNDTAMNHLINHENLTSLNICFCYSTLSSGLVITSDAEDVVFVLENILFTVDRDYFL